MKLAKILLIFNHYAAPGQVWKVTLKYSEIRLFRQSLIKASKWNIKCPFEVLDEAFMAIELTEKAFGGKSGTVKYPDEFMEDG